MRFTLALLVCSFLLPQAVFAHLPRNAGMGEAFIVDEPTISKAYYGTLPGGPAIYSFTTTTTFPLYVGILVPDVAQIGKDVSADIYRNGERIATLGGPQAKWTHWYEEYGGDWYFDGGSFEAEGAPGNYAIAVSSPDNEGRYVLAVGKEERFTLRESLRTVMTLPEIKEYYFDKFPFSAYVAPVVLPFFLLSLILPTALFFLARFLFRRFRK